MPNKTDAFFSGFMPSNASLVAAGNQLTYTIRVMDMKPIWYYCSQAKHCQSGMVGAINALVTCTPSYELVTANISSDHPPVTEPSSSSRFLPQPLPRTSLPAKLPAQAALVVPPHLLAPHLPVESLVLVVLLAHLEVPQPVRRPTTPLSKPPAPLAASPSLSWVLPSVRLLRLCYCENKLSVQRLFDGDSGDELELTLAL